MTGVVIVAHHERAEAAAMALDICSWLAARGHKAWLPPEDAEALGLVELGSETDPSTADLAVAVGGDGTVLRTVQLVDGVKALHGDSWVLALPDPEEPITHVWAEATSDAEARRLSQEYGRRIRQLLR